VAQTPVYEVCDHRAEWRVGSGCFQYGSDNRWEARSRPFGKSQTCGKDACLRHPPDVRKAFRSERAVNDALRWVIELRKVGSDKRGDYSSNGG
jgi:hypothetical protein